MPDCRFGKHPPKVDYRTLRFKSYATAALAPPPPTSDALVRINKALGDIDPTKLFPMDGNDRYGDCTIAALAHSATTYHGLVGQKRVTDEKAVVKLYLSLTGGVDSGLAVLDVLKSWRSHPIFRDEILAYVSIAPRDHLHVQQAIAFFGGVYLGFQVQANAQEDFFARKPWTPGPLTNDGHAVFATGYDQAGVTVLTWGNTQRGSWEWWDECVDEAYAILPPQAKDPKFAPGFNFAQLQADLALVAN